MTKKIFFSLCFCLLLIKTSHAQLAEYFTDGDLTVNPSWTGNLTNWTTNAALQLQSNNNTTNSSFYISTTSTSSVSTQWEFYCRLNFNPSSVNYIDVYLTASVADISSATTTGYFVRIGNTDDEISLYRKNATGIVKIIDGINGILNRSNNVMKIKVTRDGNHQWILWRDLTGTGAGFTSEGTVTDATYTTSAFFGILVKQSTASFFQKHFLDDIVVQPYLPDIAPPAIQSVVATSVNTLDVLFNEPVDQLTSEAVNNYTVNNVIGNPAVSVRDPANTALVHLAFTTRFPNGTNCILTVNGVKDLSNNSISNGTAGFIFYTPQRYDVVIDEIMADPAPQVALPNSEWIELKNITPFPIDLQGWTISDLSGQSGPMPIFILKPDSFVIICNSSALSNMMQFGAAIAVTGFPSLDNDNDQLVVQTAQGKTMHAVHYSSAWYKNDLKKEGGWSIEMIDTKTPCNGFSNWIASADEKGGTPGQKNTADAVNKDEKAPELLRAFAIDSVTIHLVFDEPLDSTIASAMEHYNISDGIGIPLDAEVVSPVFDAVIIRLNNILQTGKIYTATVTNVTDCAGNNIDTKNTAKTGIAVAADNLDIVINEILFNPLSSGVDYVEIYNRSNKIIDLKNIYIANRNNGGTVSNIVQVSNEHRLFFPEEFLVITSDANIVKRDFITQSPDAFTTIQNMPSLNDDKGYVIILNGQGNIVDELLYDEKWHFKLIDNNEGVALERINYNAATQQQDNWHSASANVGYGTPTYKNSQYQQAEEVKGTITIIPEIMSPDNDGIDDFLTIQYDFPSTGYVANILVFDATGRLVRNLQRNALCGLQGYFRWDGLGEKNQQLPTGIYIVHTEIFNLNGKKKQFKNAMVLARRN